MMYGVPSGYRPQAEDEPVADPRAPLRRPIPRAYLTEFAALTAAGLSDADAESVLAVKHGLSPADGQRQRFNLWELAHLEEVRHRHPEPGSG
jgi:hypothetical protein